GATTAGTDGSALVDADYVGSAAGKSGLYAFDENDDFLMLSVPGITTVTVQKGLESYAEQRQDIFVIQEVPQGLAPSAAVTHVQVTANLASSYEAIYYPWVKAVDIRDGMLVSLPPSGYVQGVYARTFSRRN